jgi:glucokinase
VLGPGTGLGVACFVPFRHKPIVIASEGGHATLAGTCDREDQIIGHLRQRFGHASAERAISGPGLENIYQAIGALDQVQTPLQNATQITRSAVSGECKIAVEALNIFCALLGSFAGNVALTFGARGGVYIAGGVAPRIVDFMRSSDFRVRFESKGRFYEYLKPILVHIITHSSNVHRVAISARARPHPCAALNVSNERAFGRCYQRLRPLLLLKAPEDRETQAPTWQTIGKRQNQQLLHVKLGPP